MTFAENLGLKMIGTFLFLSVTFSEGKTFFDDHSRGWHWYEVRPLPKKPSKKQPPLTVEQRFHQEQKLLKHLLYRALLEPRLEFVKAYQEAQKKWMEKSQTFANLWQDVLLQHPSLDPTLMSPTNHLARQVHKLEEREKTEKILKGLSQKYGLFFFFKGDCGYCHAFAPIVQAFSERYGWLVMAVSLDGSTLKELEMTPKIRVVRDNGMVQKLRLTGTPALVAVDPKTDTLVPIAYGMVSLQELEERTVFLSTISKRL